MGFGIDNLIQIFHGDQITRRSQNSVLLLSVPIVPERVSDFVVVAHTVVYSWNFVQTRLSSLLGTLIRAETPLMHKS